MGVPYRVTIKMMLARARARAARRAIRHAGILAQDGQPHRRPAAMAPAAAPWPASARAGELSYDGLKGLQKFIEMDGKFDDLSN
ncbi:hypothetical protein IGS59_07425 [Janthinobacterium sp. GW460P]|uniref:hypothetical protein n=1 Tax=unclassified Janthinobacterium TaxID=2610881 RepID=UPI00111C511F|nr:MULTISPECIES: hypothetical protein [unclassified Janthinobacterium]MCC7702061.1 hypothetical protein [Janthinobacterium sp. GW460P]MCC7707569.1 hypothetical protein [Janthinobacterium sp. GW460W]